jgi:hypothetical protein
MANTIEKMRKRLKISDDICTYMGKKFDESNIESAEALGITVLVMRKIILSFWLSCNNDELSINDLTNDVCDMLKKVQLEDEIYVNIIREIKKGGDIEQIIEKYLTDITPEQRKTLLADLKKLNEDKTSDSAKYKNA